MRSHFPTIALASLLVIGCSGKEEWTFKNGKLDGVFNRWYENGQIRSRATYKDGNLDGVFIMWDENGRKKTQSTYKNGKRV